MIKAPYKRDKSSARLINFAFLNIAQLYGTTETPNKAEK